MAGGIGGLGDELERLANYLARRFAEGETLEQARARSPLRFAGLAEEDVAAAARFGRLAEEVRIEATALDPGEEIGELTRGLELLAEGGLAQVTVAYGRQLPSGGYDTYRTYIVRLTPEATAQSLLDAARAEALNRRSPGIDEAYSDARIDAFLPFNLYED